MSCRFIATTLLVTLFCSGLSAGSAWSSDLSQAIARCEASPHCQHGARDRSGRVEFGVQRDGFVLRFKCTQDGKCESVQPGETRIGVLDVTAIFSAE